LTKFYKIVSAKKNTIVKGHYYLFDNKREDGSPILNLIAKGATLVNWKTFR
jgi:hypothetical protein